MAGVETLVDGGMPVLRVIEWAPYTVPYGVRNPINGRGRENVPVTHKNAAADDPGRSLALLWGPQDRPGRSGITVRAIIDAAVELADANGVDALSMRAVA